MYIYITNLKTSKARKLHMEKQLEGFNLPYEFFDCVIGADLSEEEIQRKCDVKSIKKQNSKVEWFNRGIIGCTMTNQNIYHDIIKRNCDYALYLEDDVLLPDNFSKILEYTERNIRQGDIFLLFWKAWSPVRLNKPEITTPFNHQFYLRNKGIGSLTGGSAFIVTREAAQKMLSLNTPIHTTPDNWKYFYENNAIERLFFAFPPIVQPANFKSTMHKGIFANFRALIYQYKIFPFYQFLNYKRNKLLNKTHQVVFLNDDC